MMKRNISTLKLGTIGLLLALAVLVAAPAAATPPIPAFRGENAIWADGGIWDTIITPATFGAPENPNSVDKLYMFVNLDGQRPVAEAAPYENDYNGGRWWVHLVEFTALGLLVHDPDGDGVANFELTSDDAVLQHAAFGHLTITFTDEYFECPLVHN